MANTDNIQVDVILAPHFNDSGAAEHLLVKVTFGGLTGGLNGGLQGGSLSEPQNLELFLGHPHWPGVGHGSHIDLDKVHAQDNDGTLEFKLVTDSQGGRVRWAFDRDLRGMLVIELQALPLLEENIVEGSGALIRDQGGLVGVGASFIPLPNSSAKYDLSLTWNLSNAPSGTRAVSSAGGGDVSCIGGKDSLALCVFMVGPVNSCPPRPPGTGWTSEFCGTYWLGDLPDSLDRQKDFSSNMFPHLSNFFSDPHGSYRAFLRKIPKGQKGTPFYSSSLIDYDDDSKEEQDWELVRLLNSTMIATWAKLDPEDDGTSNDWFARGLTHLYSIYLPYRFKQRTPNYFRATLNGYLTSYFTNPLVTMPLSDVIAQRSSLWHADSVTAMRGCVYMIRMDCFMRRASVKREAGVERPIDEIVADICGRRRRGEKVQTKDWLRHVASWIGEDEAEEHLRRLKDGEVMDLEDMSTSFGGIVSEEQNVMEMGFDKTSLDEGEVKGVVEGSSAYIAGLRNGDIIKWHSRPEYCEREYDAKFKMLVERDSNELEVEYWPRGEKVVKVWQSRKKET